MMLIVALVLLASVPARGQPMGDFLAAADPRPMPTSSTGPLAARSLSSVAETRKEPLKSAPTAQSRASKARVASTSEQQRAGDYPYGDIDDLLVLLRKITNGAWSQDDPQSRASKDDQGGLDTSQDLETVSKLVADLTQGLNKVFTNLFKQDQRDLESNLLERVSSKLGASLLGDSGAGQKSLTREGQGLEDEPAGSGSRKGESANDSSSQLNSAVNEALGQIKNLLKNLDPSAREVLVDSLSKLTRVSSGDENHDGNSEKAATRSAGQKKSNR